MNMRISKTAYWVYFLSLAICFLLFKQSDLTHTNASSFAYLYGHFSDFYDYNLPRMGDNNYLPLVYWIFALWNLPLKLLGLIPELTSTNWVAPSPIITVWSKSLLAITFFASVLLLQKISKQISQFRSSDTDCSFSIGSDLLFATSPFAIFVIFIFSGYDIFGVFFCLLGLHAYFEKKFLQFGLWFSLAISLKYFAAFIYLPLVLIIEKRIFHLILYGLLGLLFTGLQFGLYWHSEVFRSEILTLATRKAGGETTHIKLYLVGTSYCAMCLWLFFSRINLDKERMRWSRTAVFSCLFSYALLFSLVRWHPQWIIILLPYIFLGYHFVIGKKYLYWLEFIGYFGFICWCVNGWVQNVDITMVYGGVFGDLLPKAQHFGAEILDKRWMGFSRTAFYLFLYSPLLVFLIESFFQKILATNPLSNTVRAIGGPPSETHLKVLLWIRFSLAAYFFLGITAICLFWP